jgi:Uncharacterized conserved protein
MKKLHYLKYFFRYLLDRQVPFYKKIWIYLVLIYFISPLDLIPDPILGIGWLDDAVILIWGIFKLLAVLEKYGMEKEQPPHFKDENGVTVENVEYKVHDD